MKWPVGFEPHNSPVYVRNEIEIAAPPERIWRWLTRVARWPEWYPHSYAIEFVTGKPPDLALGTEFRWSTFGFSSISRVIIFEPPYELAWDARGVLYAFHGWLIVPEENGKSRVVTEVCHNGIVPTLSWWALRMVVHAAHQTWLECLKQAAEGGEPP
ncbi:MAG TPA: SRPBCC domain-containing protein [Candidatus Binataceae bacterium]|nr:SRPBCC domain-containing protein [Candidatus Binataceae bacterium]